MGRTLLRRHERINDVRIARTNSNCNSADVCGWKSGSGLAPSRSIGRVKDADAPLGREESRGPVVVRNDAGMNAIAPFRPGRIACGIDFSLKQTNGRSGDQMVRIGRIDGDGKEGFARQIGRTGSRRLGDPSCSAVIGANHSDAAEGW